MQSDLVLGNMDKACTEKQWDYWLFFGSIHTKIKCTTLCIVSSIKSRSGAVPVCDDGLVLANKD